MEKSSCTTILVGKNASIDGSTIISRNEDGSDQPNPQRFVVVNPEDQPKVFYTCQGKTEIPLPDNPLRYTSTPDANPHGVWAGAGINSENIAMSATETITSNARVLGADPYVPNGIGEGDIPTLVLPYIHSPKEGVLRLGELLETYGTYEPNGVVFSDVNEIWYMENYGGHHWAAVRIPDDAFVVAPNRLNIDTFDFDSEDVLYCKDLPDFIKRNNLNPDFEGLNFRHTLGSSDYKDQQYNNCRTWYVQKALSDTSRPVDEKYPFVDDPNCPDLPFLCYPKRKISIEDIKWAQSSHYEGTKWDVYGKGPEADRKKYRAIGLNRNMELHIIQLRPNVPKEIQGIHWIAFASNPYNNVVPFYANVTDTPVCYRDTKGTYDPNYYYWVVQTLAVIGDHNFDLYGSFCYDFTNDIAPKMREKVIATDKRIIEEKLTGREAQKVLEEANEEMANEMFSKTVDLLGKFVCTASHKMDLRYTLAD